MRSVTETATPVALATSRRVVVCLALFLEGMSSSSINVQIGAVRRSLDPSAVELQLVVSSFLVAYAGLLPAAGQLVDRWNRRHVFLLGVALYGVGSVACAVAPEVLALVAGRLAQGAGAALSAPAALALVTAGLGEGHERNRAVALFGAMGALGFSTGLVVPGLLVTAVGWRASFFVAVPVVLLVLAATWRLPSYPSTARGRNDLVGAAAVTVTIGVAMYLVGSLGSPHLPTLAAGLVSVAGLAAFMFVRGGVGGFPRAVFATPRVLAAGLALGAVFAGVLSSMYVLSLGLQEQGWDAFEVGLVILPQPLTFFLTSSLGARLVDVRGPGRILAAGMAVIAASLLGLTLPFGGHTVAILVAMAGIGLGMALSFPAASIAAVDATPEALRGTTASLLTTAQNIGGALGLAVMTALALVPEHARTSARPGVLAAALMLLAGGALAGSVVRRRPSRVALRVEGESA